MADRLAMYEAQAIAIERQQEIDRLTRVNEEMAERLRRLEMEREERLDPNRNPVVNPVPREQEDFPQNEIDRLVGMNEEIAERLRIPEMEREDRQDPNPNPVENPERQEREEQEDLPQEVLINPPRVVALAYGLSVPNNDLNPPAKRVQERENPSYSQKNTILVLRDENMDVGVVQMIILSLDRSKWLESQVHLPHSAYGSGAVYLNEEIYLIGGFFNRRIAYKLDKNLQWIRLADLNIGRNGIPNSCLEWNGYIWVFGGEDEDDNSLQSVERYDPKEDKWELMRDMTIPRSSAAAVLYNDGVLISGGDLAPIGNLTNTVECYNLGDGCQMKLPNMPNAEIGHSLVSFKEKLVLLAGFNDGKNVWELNPHDTKPEWKTQPAMRYPSILFTGTILDDEIYAIGGYQDGNYLDRVEIFNGENWRNGTSLPFPVAGAPLLTIPEELADRLINYKM